MTLKISEQKVILITKKVNTSGAEERKEEQPSTLYISYAKGSFQSEILEATICTLRGLGDFQNLKR